MFPSKLNRRQAAQNVAAIGAGLWLGSTADSSRAAKSPNEKLNVAFIGIGGRGSANLKGVGKTENVVGLCDVDDKRAGGWYEKYPNAKKYFDFRIMLEEMEKSIDAVVVSTPDHMHFHPAMMALGMGKHLYCEKPLAHNVWEIRQITDTARRQRVATQLGNQRHAYDNMRRVVELIRSGAIGTVTEAYSWVGGDRGMPAIPKKPAPVPVSLKWDLWIGPAKFRPYATNEKGQGALAPYNWRFWWDYGTGETGNWGCHILDIPFWALDLKYPTRVDASGPEVHDVTTPKAMATRFEFPSNAKRPGITLHWAHAKSGPAILKQKGISGKGHNTLFVGTKGMLICGFGSHALLPKEQFNDFTRPAQSIPKSPGFYQEWITACKGGPAATCNFEYTGPLAETVILGNTAFRAGGGFDWSAKTLTAGGNAKAGQYIRTEYRKGWEI